MRRKHYFKIEKLEEKNYYLILFDETDDEYIAGKLGLTRKHYRTLIVKKFGAYYDQFNEGYSFSKRVNAEKAIQFFEEKYVPAMKLAGVFKNED